MAELRAASRYAKALMELSVERKETENIEKDMKSVLDTLVASEELRDLLSSPVLKGSEKVTALKAIFSKVNPLTDQLFSLLNENNRIPILGDIARRFIQLSEQMKGQDVAQVTTAVPLTKELEAQMLKQIEKITGKKVTIENEVDDSIVGGFILRVGDLQYNASIANKLNTLKRRFTHSL